MQNDTINKRTILFRGQTRRPGERVTMAGTQLPGIWVTGGIFPQNGNGDKAIIYQQVPNVEKHIVYADTVCQYTGINDDSEKNIYEKDIILFHLKNNVDVFFKGIVEYAENQAAFVVSICEPKLNNKEVMLKDCTCITVVGNVFDGEIETRAAEARCLYNECFVIAYEINKLTLLYGSEIEVLKDDTLSNMALRLMDKNTRAEIVIGLTNFTDEWKHYNQNPVEEAKAILTKINNL